MKNSLLNLRKNYLADDVKNVHIYDNPFDFAVNMFYVFYEYYFQWVISQILAEAVFQAEADPDNIVHPIITATPQIGKSYLLSTPFLAWYLSLFPDRRILYATHTYSLAEKFTYRTLQFVRDNEDKLPYGLDPFSQTKGFWHTSKGGFVMAAGKNTAIPGYPNDLQVIDDLYASEQEAHSPRVLETVEDWWETSLSTRKQQHTLQVIIITRWSVKDIVAYLMRKMKENPNAEKYKIYNFAAITETEEDCQNDPLGRKVGESVCPERFSANYYKRRKASISLYHWKALYKGMPDSEQGHMFQESWLQYFSDYQNIFTLVSPTGREKKIPKWSCIFFQITDSNMKAEEVNDYHNTMTCALTPDFDLLVFDNHRVHIEGFDTLREIRKCRLKHMRNGQSFIKRNFAEDSTAGTIAIQEARRLKQGFLLTPIKAIKSKVERAMPLQEAMINFKVYFLSGASWLKVLIDEILEFTGEEGNRDDQVDCLAYAWHIVTNPQLYSLGFNKKLFEIAKTFQRQESSVIHRPTKDEIQRLS